MPQEVDNYHELCPLEPIASSPIHKAHLGYQASMYKATHIKTGVKYCLRRIHGKFVVLKLKNVYIFLCTVLCNALSHTEIQWKYTMSHYLLFFLISHPFLYAFFLQDFGCRIPSV